MNVLRDCSAEIYSVRRRKEMALAAPVLEIAVWPRLEAERRRGRSRGSMAGIGSRGRIAVGSVLIWLHDRRRIYSFI